MASDSHPTGARWSWCGLRKFSGTARPRPWGLGANDPLYHLPPHAESAKLGNFHFGATMKVIFLDIDGVLNCHQSYNWDWNTIATINPVCVRTFNSIVCYTGAKIVISSAWRYMILNGHMDVRGFEYLLRSHGVRGEVIGHTASDEDIDERADQIGDWMEKRRHALGHDDIERYVVIDDTLSSGMDRHPFVHTDGNKGIQIEDAKKAVDLLGALAIYQEMALEAKERP